MNKFNPVMDSVFNEKQDSGKEWKSCTTFTLQYWEKKLSFVYFTLEPDEFKDQTDRVDSLAKGQKLNQKYLVPLSLKVQISIFFSQ